MPTTVYDKSATLRFVSVNGHRRSRRATSGPSGNRVPSSVLKSPRFPESDFEIRGLYWGDDDRLTAAVSRAGFGPAVGVGVRQLMAHIRTSKALPHVWTAPKTSATFPRYLALVVRNSFLRRRQPENWPSVTPKRNKRHAMQWLLENQTTVFVVVGVLILHFRQGRILDRLDALEASLTNG
jgi:hypothetical protein